MSRICSDLPRHVFGCRAGEPGNLGVLLRAVFIASSRRSLSVPKPASGTVVKWQPWFYLSKSTEPLAGRLGAPVQRRHPVQTAVRRNRDVPASGADEVE